LSNTPTVTLDELELAQIARLLRRLVQRGDTAYGNVGFNMADVQPPGSEYLTRDTCLQINIYPTTTTSTVKVSYKIMLPDGKINLAQETLAVTTAGALNQTIRNLTEGFLLSLAVTITNASTVHRGDTFVQVGLSFGSTSASPMYRLLCSGFVTTTVALAWPEGNLSDSLTGPGLLQSVTVATPGADTDWSYTFPAGFRYWVHSIAALFTTSSTVATRDAAAVFKDASANILWKLAGSVGQTASLAEYYLWGEAGTLAQDIIKNQVITMPGEFFAYPGYTVGSATTGMQAADQWSAIQLGYETWPEV